MERDTQPRSQELEEFCLEYYNASQKAIWLRGIANHGNVLTPVLNFMMANQIMLPFMPMEVLPYIKKCKSSLKLSYKTLSSICGGIDKVFKYYTINSVSDIPSNSYGIFSGLEIPQILTQFYLEENESQIDNETYKICQIKAELNFQVGENIELRMFTDVLPEGVFLIKKKHTVFHGYGVMKKYRIAVMNQEEEEEEYPELKGDS